MPGDKAGKCPLCWQWFSRLLTTYLGCWQLIWLLWASRHSRLDLERSNCWNVTGTLGLIWNGAWQCEKFFVESNVSDLLSLTRISLALERKFVESEDVILLSLILNALTLRENLLNVNWFCWAWLKFLLTLIATLLNVRTFLFLEFCTIWLSITGDSNWRAANMVIKPH